MKAAQAGHPVSPSEQTTLSEQAYRAIKAMIFRREVAPGAPLVLHSLGKQLGVSRMPVLEAIRRLERDGLVESVPQWGARVKRWSREEMMEAYCIRRALEGEAARYFVLQAKPEDWQRLVELDRRFDAELAGGLDQAEIDVIDTQLHLHIARSSGFRRLYELVENSKIITTVISGLILTMLPDAGQARVFHRGLRGCHRPLVEALLSGDPDRAVAAMWQHVDTARGWILQLGVESEGDGRA
ncbi:MAG: GntR family transcriptional regulator [Acidobacteria bacterium]|nr:GntR family transcriptional regulator [Acidobacteriota bacterium]